MTEIKPQIAILTCEYPPFPGGIGTYAAGVESVLREDNVPLVVAAPHYPEHPSLLDKENIHRIFGHHKISLAAFWQAAKIIWRLPSNGVILAADLRTIVLTHIITRIIQRKYIAMVHGSEAAKFRSKSIAFRLARRAYLKASFVAYNSQATKQIFQDGIGTPQSGEVTYLGVDARWFLPPTAFQFENKHLASIGEAVPIVCSVGRIEARKGQVNAIRALSLARSQYGLDDCVYVVAGKVEESQYANTIVEEARKEGIDVILSGRLSENDLKLLYARAACHALLAESLPGKIEGFGLVLLEAAAQGCPSVATGIGGIPEVMGDTGIVVDPDDLQCAAKAFADYAMSPRHRQSSGEAARLRANQFTWRRCVEQTFKTLTLDRG